ncbi:MAG: hypothetical protein U0324_09080 [Polyangiales bacterium]
MIEQRRPRSVAVSLEFVLQRQSQRVDVLLLRRTRAVEDGDARVLRSLWRHVRRVGLLEFKSVARLFAAGDLYRLVALGWHWLARNPKRTPDDLVLVLVVPALTDTLLDELARCGAVLVAQEPGYHAATVRGVELVVAETDVVSESERDDHLRVFSHHAIETEEVVEWLREHTDLPEDAVLSPEEVDKNRPFITKLAKSIPLRIRLEGEKPEDIVASLTPEERLAGLAPEERLAGLAPQERLAGIAPEDIARALSEADRVLALPDAALRALPADYLATLPEDAQARIRARLAR